MPPRKNAALPTFSLLVSVGLFGCRGVAEQAGQATHMGESWKPYGPELDGILESGQSRRSPRAPAHTLTVPGGMRFTLPAAGASLQARQVALNGTTLALAGNDELPALDGERFAAGTVSLAPASITFLAFPKAGNQACR